MQRHQDIDAARGLAILLVVFGHLVARADRANVHWYEPLRRAVYAFHMPFFLYLSGLAAAVSGSFLTPPAALPRLLKSRARRLLIPFFGLGALIVAGKVAAGSFIFVDNAPRNIASGLADLIWHTSVSQSISVWYLFVLFTFSVFFPLLLRGEPGRVKYLLFGALVLYVLPLPAYVYLDRIGRYAIFFLLGAVAGTRMDAWTQFIENKWHFCFVLLLFGLVLVAVCGAYWPAGVSLLPIGVLSMPALHGLVRHLPASWCRIFLWLGRYSFVIYLFNTIFLGISKGLLLRLCSWNGTNFYGFAVALMMTGTLGPVALKHFAFRRIKPLDRLTD